MRQAYAQDMQRISFHTAFALEDTYVGAPVSLQLKLWVRLSHPCPIEPSVTTGEAGYLL